MDSENFARKKLIAEKFFEFFLENGMVDTIIDNVAKQLHMSKKTIYKEFPQGKEEILYYLYYQIALRVIEDWKKVNRVNQDLSRQLNSFLCHIFDTAVPHVLRNAAKSTDDYLIENRIVSLAFKDACEPVLQNLLKKGKERGEFHFNDVTTTFRFIYSIMAESMVIIHETKKVKIKKTVLDHIFKLLA